MKNLSILQFIATGMVLSEYQEQQIKDAEQLQEEVLPFYPCEVKIVVSTQDNDDYYERAEVILKHESIEMIISKDQYRGKYVVNSYYHNQFKNLSSYSRADIIKTVTEPVTMGVLSAKKVLAWVNYYEQTNALLKAADNKSLAAKEAFIATLKDLPIKWNDKHTEGSIVRNGVEFSFKIGEDYTSQEVRLHYSVANTLDSFLKLSQNNYGRV